MTMNSDKCIINHGDRVVATGKKREKLVYLITEKIAECHAAEERDIELQHRRLGHVLYSTLNTMVKAGTLPGSTVKMESVCTTCSTAKQSRKPFSSTTDEMEQRESDAKALLSDLIFYGISLPFPSRATKCRNLHFC